MNILIASIGKWKSGPERSLFEHYLARCKWKVTLRELEIKKPLPPKELQLQEAQKLLEACGKCEHRIALDERGKEISSIDLARHLQKQNDNGIRDIAFLIGGADGLHDSVKKAAQQTLSFGRLTWPHLLVRALLAEQLYRAQTIIAGHPYHRE